MYSYFLDRGLGRRGKSPAYMSTLKERMIACSAELLFCERESFFPGLRYFVGDLLIEPRRVAVIPVGRRWSRLFTWLSTDERTDTAEVPIIRFA
jgi:hypothetical protein